MPRRRRNLVALAILFLLALAAAGAALAASSPPVGLVPTVHKARAAAPDAKAVATGNRIDYYNGPIMAGRVNVYFIWYGNWNGNTATTLLPRFVNDLNRTLYYNINTTYSQMQIANDATGHVIDPYQSHVANSVALAGQLFD